MRRTFAAATAGLLVLAACNSPGLTGPDPEPGFGKVSTTILRPGNPPSFALGSDITAQMRNSSTKTVIVGALDCVTGYERWNDESQEWDVLETLRACISIALVVAPGERVSFAPPSPDAPGRYRLVFNAYPQGGDAIRVRSNSFDVE